MILLWLIMEYCLLTLLYFGINASLIKLITRREFPLTKPLINLIFLKQQIIMMKSEESNNMTTSKQSSSGEYQSEDQGQTSQGPIKNKQNQNLSRNNQNQKNQQSASDPYLGNQQYQNNSRQNLDQSSDHHEQSITPIVVALLPSILSSITGHSWMEYVLFSLVLFYLYMILKSNLSQT